MRSPSVKRFGRETKIAVAIALLVAIVNALGALALTPNRHAKNLSDHVSDSRFNVLVGEGVYALLLAVVLVPIAWGILRRRRGAWIAAIVLLLIVTIADLVSGDTPLHVIAPLIAAVVLFFLRRKLVSEPYRLLLRRQMLPQDEAIARTGELLEKYGRDSMAPFKLRRDIGHLFSANGDAVLGFRVENRVLLVAGDPLGSPQGVLDVVSDARNLAREAGLRFGVYAASAEVAERLCAEFDMHSIYLGCEAIVSAKDFTLQGHKIKKVRQAHRRVQREGYELVMVQGSELTSDDHAALVRCQEAGRSPDEEQSFAMAPTSFDAPGMDHALIAMARHTENGSVAAFMAFVPLKQRSMWSLALQLRDPTTPNGTIDALLVNVLLAAQEQGVDEVSLNFAAGRRYMYEEVKGFWPHMGRALALTARKFTQIDDLRYHNEKFSPTWEQRFGVVDHKLEVPHVAFALIWQEGQLPRPNALIRPAWPTMNCDPEGRALSAPAPPAGA